MAEQAKPEEELLNFAKFPLPYPKIYVNAYALAKGVR
jgi:hypothetical protein